MLWQIRDVRPLERWEEGEQHLGKDRGRERVRKPVLRKKGDGDRVRGGRGSWLQVRGPCSNQGTQADAVCERFPPGLQVLGPGSSASQPGLEFLLSWMVRLSGHLSHSFWKMGPFFPERKPGLRIPHPTSKAGKGRAAVAPLSPASGSFLLCGQLRGTPVRVSLTPVREILFLRCV